MRKKLLGMLLVAILVVCLFFVGSGVILMLAPGVELFGIRYIGGGYSVATEVKSLDNFDGESIYIESNNLPINITYTTSYNSNVDFSQDFQGFTKTSYDKASLIVYLDDSNNIHIETQEMVKWFYGKEDEKSNYLNINLSRVSAMNKNLYVTSNTGKVTINGDAVYKNFSVKTGKNLIINDSIVADNVELALGNSINIDNKISAINYNLKSTGGNINVSTEVEGDLVAKTKGGDIKFVSCMNFTAETGGGSIKAYGEGLGTVKAKTSIVTKGGNVYLSNVSTEDKNATCTISSISGDVKISSMQDGTITSERGDVVIDFARAITVNSKIGSVSIKTVEEQIVVNGKNGKVSLGENGQVKNIKVYTTTGKINVANSVGEVDLTSKNSSVSLKNLSSEKINVYAGRAFTGEGLKGDVVVYANADVDMKFVGVTGDVSVSTGTKTNYINIDAGATSYLDVDYDIVSTKGKLAKVYVGDDLLDEGSKLTTGSHDGRHLIDIETSYAKVVLLLDI